MRKEFHLCGLGNAIVDVFVEVNEAEFADLGFERGSMRLVDVAEQKSLLERFKGRDTRMASGGSVANSTIAFSQLGGDAAFIGCVGDDRYGLFYASEFEELDIDMGNPAIVGETTGTCIALITPDAERTMRTCLGVSSHLAAKHVAEDRIKNSDWLFIEGYVFANPETGQGAIREAVRIAKAAGTKIAVTCSEAFIPNIFGDALGEALRHADLLFANESEACSLAKASSAEDAFAKLRGEIPSLIVTAGSRGAYVRHNGEEAFIQAFPCEPKDLTGAGDMFAGSFLYGITHNVPLRKAARAACYLAHRVIQQVGARLHHGARLHWDEAIANHVD